MWNAPCWNTHSHTHTHSSASWPHTGPCLALFFTWVWEPCCSLSVCLSVSHRTIKLHSYTHKHTAHIHITAEVHTNSSRTCTRSHKLTYTHHAAPHFCLGKKVITFSPCLNAFKSLSGAIPRWASEIHLNSFWESKQSYCCALKLWLERKKKMRGGRGGGRRRLVNKTVGRYYFSVFLSISFTSRSLCSLWRG